MDHNICNPDSAGIVVLPADSLSRRLANRYLYVLIAVAALVVLDQVVIQPLLLRLSWYAPVINVAGRQRMLSQKLAKAALTLAITDGEEDRRQRCDELQATLTQWSNAHSALRDGSPRLPIPAIRSADIEAEWNRITPHFEAMCAAAEQLVRDERNSQRREPAAALKTVVDHEAAFLESMERIVALMENQAGHAVFQLRFCAAAIAGGIVSLLLALGRFVIRPATVTIRRQLEDLESRVATRTCELSAALEALRQEVAEREQSEARTQRLASQLAHAGRVWTMGHLTAGLAHELNQPLTTIANYANACDAELARSDEPVRVERLRTYLNSAKLAALRAGEITRRMRNFVRPSAPAAVEVEINKLIREVLVLCRNEADHAGATVSVQLDCQQAIVTVDPIQIQQVLVNLIQNSLQAMHECPSDERWIRIVTTVTIDSVQVEITDSGPGFATTDPEDVFEPFYTTKHDGLGIGLSICRSIVENHGGTIWAVASSCDGTTVAFTLPCSVNDARSRPTRAECVCR